MVNIGANRVALASILSLFLNDQVNVLPVFTGRGLQVMINVSHGHYGQLVLSCPVRESSPPRSASFLLKAFLVAAAELFSIFLLLRVSSSQQNEGSNLADSSELLCRELVYNTICDTLLWTLRSSQFIKSAVPLCHESLIQDAGL